MRGQVALLDRAQGAGGGRVAGEDDQRATGVEQPLDRFERVVVDHVEAARAVGRPCVVGQVEVVVAGELSPQGLEDGEAAESGIEDADHRGRSLGGIVVMGN